MTTVTTVDSTFIARSDISPRQGAPTPARYRTPAGSRDTRVDLHPETGAFPERQAKGHGKGLALTLEQCLGWRPMEAFFAVKYFLHCLLTRCRLNTHAAQIQRLGRAVGDRHLHGHRPRRAASDECGAARLVGHRRSNGDHSAVLVGEALTEGQLLWRATGLLLPADPATLAVEHGDIMVLLCDGENHGQDA